MKTPIKLADQAVPLGTSGVRYTVLAGLLSLALFTTATATAADFPGSLNSVSITDSAGTNKAPSAVINYTKDGNTFVFDASKSSDPDGSIVKYTWDFGDSTQALGLTVAHNFAGFGVYNVSLTVVDDKGGGAVTQMRLNTASGITDDFSTDTSANYTATIGGIVISSGTAIGSKNYSANTVINNTNTGSSDHYAQADLQYISLSYNGIVIGASASSSSATGYCVNMITPTKLELYTFNGSSFKATGKYWKPAISLVSGKSYTVKVIKTGSTFALFIDGAYQSPDITDSTYTGGQFIGFDVDRTSGYSATIDNFTGGGL